MRTWMAVLLLLAACSHQGSKPMSPVVATGATCDQVGNHVIQLLPASHNDDSNAELAKQLAGVLQDRCAKDAWTAQARQCIFDAKELKDADGCKQFLTKAQVDAVDKTMDERFPKKSEEAAAPAAGSAPPPPAETPAPSPPPPPKTRAPRKKASPKATKSGDPCEGGE